MKRMRRAFGRAPLVALGAALVLPLILVVSALLVVESRLGAPADAAPGAADQPSASTYAQTFSMTIYEEGRTVRLWLKDLDSAPYFRQTIEADGKATSDQLYRFDEQTLYTAERGADGALSWSSASGLTPASLQLSDLAAGPGAWAAQYGPGEQEIPLAQGPVKVTIHSVDETIDSDVFELPEGADPVPADG